MTENEQKLKYWETQALRSHWIIVPPMIIVFICDKLYTIVPLLVAFVWITICFYKHSLYRYKTDANRRK